MFLVLALYFFIERKKREAKQLSYIENYTFPKRVRETIASTYPHLTEADIDLVLEGLRDYFRFARQASGKMVSMPSQVVDVAWHAFLLFTKIYQTFCKKSFGKFFHHHPAEAMKSKTLAQDGIKRVWNLACKKENISPSTPHTLPLLFALDAQLNIPDGFKYTLNCKGTSNSGYCASDIGCGGDGCAGDSSDSGCGGGCGGD